MHHFMDLGLSYMAPFGFAMGAFSESLPSPVYSTSSPNPPLLWLAGMPWQDWWLPLL
ncbi:uncharacterized protein LACBIDRAFT_318500 [Laccaria bicolor S238N-H82]|uniref:Predicted protein n=1 Tax=Laccaria bicolor (strain S238N-H82 / ATCC MYA-4686) TaxID=486041 RepID=B0E2K1_LACBS|nr:uncharacterized protein LACBIDRAFT_318500 [Laccaria bicolor S238N-H82]EDQ98940.1 predicted protein [Laccaria bicolor S238N-H82]|eukprot:XP_001890421.1 predicted protein [Laccaria bicolor S238N-H82]